MPTITVTLVKKSKKNTENVFRIKTTAGGGQTVVPEHVHAGSDTENDPLINGVFTVRVTFTDDTTSEEELTFEDGDTTEGVFVDVEKTISSVEVDVEV